MSSASTMAEHPKSQKHPKFGHLPRSTSGPQECALTASPPIPLDLQSMSHTQLTSYLAGRRTPPLPIPQQRLRLFPLRTKSVQAPWSSPATCPDIGTTSRTCLFPIQVSPGRHRQKHIHDKH